MEPSPLRTLVYVFMIPYTWWFTATLTTPSVYIRSRFCYNQMAKRAFGKKWVAAGVFIDSSKKPDMWDDHYCCAGTIQFFPLKTKKGHFLGPGGSPPPPPCWLKTWEILNPATFKECCCPPFRVLCLSLPGQHPSEVNLSSLSFSLIIRSPSELTTSESLTMYAVSGHQADSEYISLEEYWLPALRRNDWNDKNTFFHSGDLPGGRCWRSFLIYCNSQRTLHAFAKRRKQELFILLFLVSRQENQQN